MMTLFDWGKRTYIMGILNMTPDSFSDGGQYNNLENAIERAKQMASNGADIFDIGGESTRPGATYIEAKEEINRVIPLVKALTELNLPVSIDTYKAETAEAAIKAGATLLNDIWGLKADPEIAQVAAKSNVYVCLMHNRKKAEYTNLLEEMMKDLEESVHIAVKAGISQDRLIIDPGLGFAKTYLHNMDVMKNLEVLKKMGFPVLLGASRKSFIGLTLDLPVEQRLEGTIATTVIGISKGVDIVRVHDVLENKRAAVMADKIYR